MSKTGELYREWGCDMDGIRGKSRLNPPSCQVRPDEIPWERGRIAFGDRPPSVVSRLSPEISADGADDRGWILTGANGDIPTSRSVRTDLVTEATEHEQELTEEDLEI
jgi:hypothetical protein